MSYFSITLGRGFHITFENGVTVSVQFGPGNYSDNYSREFSADANREAGERGSSTAEVAIWDKDGRWLSFEAMEFSHNNSEIKPRCTADEVLELMSWAEKQ